MKIGGRSSNVMFKKKVAWKRLKKSEANIIRISKNENKKTKYGKQILKMEGEGAR